MSLDFDAIRKAYDNVVTIDDTAGAFDANGNPVSLDQSKINMARAKYTGAIHFLAAKEKMSL